jgi:hypothetical protein
MKFNQLSKVLGSFLLLAGATSLLGQSVVAPKVSKDAKLPAAQGDFQSFFYLAEGQLLKSTPEVGFVPACF